MRDISPCQSWNFIKIKPARPMVIVPDQCGSNSPKIGLFFIRTFGAISTISGGLYVCSASPSRREGMGSDNRTKVFFWDNR